MINYFLKNRVFTWFLLFLLVFGGFLSFLFIPKESDPDVTIPIVVVTTPVPGASTKTIADLVTKPIETRLINNITSYESINSTTKEGVSSVVVEFKTNVDLREKTSDIQDQIDIVKNELPDDAEDSIVTRVSFEDEPVYYFALTSRLVGGELRSFADKIEDEIKDIPGVSDVNISGVPKRQYSVILNPEKINQYGLTLSEIEQSIRSSDASFPLGSLTIDNINYGVTFDGQINTISDLENIVIKGTNNSSVHLKDIAIIKDDLKAQNSQVRTVTKDSTEQALNISVVKRKGANILKLNKDVKAYLSDLETKNSDVQIFDIFNMGDEISTNISDLSKTALQTTILVIILVMLALGITEGLIAGIAIPISFLISFMSLYATGNTINFLSLFSLILVVGLMVDAVVVITEGITKYREEGKTPEEAARKTLKIFGAPVFAGTLTTISVFFPLLFLSGVMGQFIKAIPATVITVLIVSLMVALIFIPALGSNLLKNETRFPKLKQARQKFIKKFLGWYRKNLISLLKSKPKRRLLNILTTLGFVGALTLVGSGLLPSQFLPSDEYNIFFADIQYPFGTTLEENSIRLQNVENLFIQNEYVETIITEVGSPSSFGVEGKSGEYLSSMTIIVSSKKVGNKALAQLQNEAASIGDANVSVFAPASGPSAGPPFVVKLTGDNIDEINNSVPQIEEAIRELDGTTNIQTSLDIFGSRFSLVPKREAINATGLNPALLNLYIRQILFGSDVIEIDHPSSSDPVDVNLKFALNRNASNLRDINNTSLDSILQIPIITPNGEVPIGSLVDVVFEQSVPIISKEEGKFVASVSSFLTPGYFTQAVVKEFNDSFDRSTLPGSVNLSFGGETADTADSQVETLIALFAGLALVIIVLVGQFNSFRQAFLIMSVIPLGLIGVIFGLFFFNQTMSFTASLGFVALAGIVINNSIILIDVMCENEENQGQDKFTRIINGATSRLRPILLTTATTVVGMIPLLFTSPIWQPLAFSVISGLVFSSVLTLIMVPALYNKFGK